jgi:hypothetical protein
MAVILAPDRFSHSIWLKMDVPCQALGAKSAAQNA